jgi:hypothetical protein
MAVLDMAGIWIMVIGAILAFFAIAGVLPGKKKVGGAIALVFIVAGLVLAGPMLGGLLVIAPAVEDGVPVYDVRFTAQGLVDNTDCDGAEDGSVTVIIAADFKSMDLLDTQALFAAETALDAATAGGCWEFSVNRLDPGDADDTAIIYMDVGTVATIVDVTAGTTFPLIDFNIQTDAYDVIFQEDDNTAIGFLTGSKYYDTLAPGGTQGYQANIGFNDAGFDAAAGVIGMPYSFTMVAAGQTLTVSIVLTA